MLLGKVKKLKLTHMHMYTKENCHQAINNNKFKKGRKTTHFDDFKFQIKHKCTMFGKIGHTFILH